MVLTLSFPVLLFPASLSLVPVSPVLSSLGPAFPALLFLVLPFLMLLFPVLSFPGLSQAPVFPALLPFQASAFLLRPLPLQSDSSGSGLLSPDH